MNKIVKWLKNHPVEIAMVAIMILVIILCIQITIDIKKAGGMRQIIVNTGQGVISVYEDIVNDKR